jgi:hypothetical protein
VIQQSGRGCGGRQSHDHATPDRRHHAVKSPPPTARAWRFPLPSSTAGRARGSSPAGDPTRIGAHSRHARQAKRCIGRNAPLRVDHFVQTRKDTPSRIANADCVMFKGLRNSSNSISPGCVGGRWVGSRLVDPDALLSCAVPSQALSQLRRYVTVGRRRSGARYGDMSVRLEK